MERGAVANWEATIAAGEDPCLPFYGLTVRSSQRSGCVLNVATPGEVVGVLVKIIQNRRIAGRVDCNFCFTSAQHRFERHDSIRSGMSLI